MAECQIGSVCRCWRLRTLLTVPCRSSRYRPRAQLSRCESTKCSASPSVHQLQLSTHRCHYRCGAAFVSTTCWQRPLYIPARSLSLQIAAVYVPAETCLRNELSGYADRWNCICRPMSSLETISCLLGRQICKSSSLPEMTTRWRRDTAIRCHKHVRLSARHAVRPRFILFRQHQSVPRRQTENFLPRPAMICVSHGASRPDARNIVGNG